MNTLRPTPAEAARELLRLDDACSSLLAYTTFTKPDYHVGWHHRLLCDYLDRFVAGDIRRLMIFMPPQHGKSELVSRRLPAYLLGRKPKAQLIACSYTAELANDMNRDVQKIMDDDPHLRLFPQTRLGGKNVRTVVGPNPLRNSDKFETVNMEGRRTGGSYKSAGVGGGITGRPMDYGIIDDPIKGREMADSPAHRAKVWGWYNGDFLSRTHGGSSILLTCTRWNQDDLPGMLLAKAEEDAKADQWVVLKLPAINEHGPTEVDPRQAGEPLWPERHPLESLEAKRASSPYDWASLYQQNPRAQGSVEWPDEYFSRSIWFDEWPDGLLFRVLSCDPSKGTSEHGDYSAWVTVAIDRDACLWVDANLERRPVEKIVADGLDLYQVHQPRAVVIEVNQFQSLLAVAFKQAARQQRLGVLPIYGITNTLKKEIRIRSIGEYLAQGKVKFKTDSAGARLVVQQLREFPSSAYDDGPDALEMAVRMIKHLLGQRREQRGQPELIR